MQLLQFESPLYSMSLKPWFDKVIAKIKWCSFLTHMVVSASMFKQCSYVFYAMNWLQFTSI